MRDETDSTEARRGYSWLAWSLAGLCVAMFVASVALWVLTRSAQVPSSWGVDLTISGLLAFGPFLAFPTVGALIASRCPRNPIGWILLADGFLWMFIGMTDYYGVYGVARPGSVPFPVGMAGLNNWLWVPAVGLLGTYPILLFPDGRLPSRRWRPLAWLSGLVIVLLSVGVMLTPEPLQNLGGVRNPFGLEGAPWVADAVMVILPLLTLCMLASAVSLVVRYRRSRGEERAQIKWIAFAASFVGLLYLIAMVSSLVFPSETWFAAGSPSWSNLLDSAVLLSFTGVPIAAGFAVLKYRLYDIEVIINRALIYGALTASVVGIYVLVVGYLGALFRTEGNLTISLVATGLVAVLFAPLRERLQRGVNRLMYGERDEPYKVLSRLGQRLEATLAPDAVLPTVVKTVTEALKLPYAAIEPKQNDAFETAAVIGKPVDDPLRLPLVYGGETVGRLVLGPRSAGEGFTPADRRLLDELVRQVGVAVHAARLTDEALRLSSDLQCSRERLVTAREEERRRLRRDLHDGLGPRLAGLTMGAEAARELIPSDSARAEEVLAGLTEQAQAAVSDVRRLVYALRPPALDALGLTGALRSHASHHENGGLRISVEAPEELPPLPAAVEVATYRIALEALNNVVRHAGARNCTIRLALDETPGALSLEIADDGRGIGEERGTGVGLSSMRERAEELGGFCMVEAVPPGGTRVRACLPCARDEVVEDEMVGPNRREA